MTTPDTAGLPCPFCGHIGVNVHEASTFRWVVAECDGCGAQGPEARRDTTKSWPNEAEDTPKAIAEWNTRAAQAAQPAPDPSGIHSCGWHCDNPACIKAQRNEMRDRLEAQAAQPTEQRSGNVDPASPASSKLIAERMTDAEVMAQAAELGKRGQLLVGEIKGRKPLSDDEVWENDEIMAINADANFGMPRLMDFVRAVEAAHRIGEPS